MSRTGAVALIFITGVAILLAGRPRTAITPVAAQSAQALPGGGQFPAYRAPRLSGTNQPNLNGIWQALTSADWDVQGHDAQPGLHPELEGTYDAQPAGQSIVEGGEIPYKPEMLAKKRANFEKRAVVDVISEGADWYASGDPELKCYLPGVPRATYMPFPFQIVQGSGSYILIAYEYASTTRTIRMNSNDKPPADSWMGWSRGHWEGDTLVVDVVGFNDLTWFDRAGDFHSDALHVVERYTPVSPYHLQYEATIDDPKVFTRPWKISLPLYRRMDKGAQLLEDKCVPFAEELLYGKLRRTPGGPQR
jgi:hypothetical protein